MSPERRRLYSNAFLLACKASRWRGDTARCRWCNADLGKKRRWCSRDCREQVIANHVWGSWYGARYAALARDKWRCVQCGEPATSVHHKKPLGGREGRGYGCQHHLRKVESLCHPCHMAVHADIRWRELERRFRPLLSPVQRVAA